VNIEMYARVTLPHALQQEDVSIDHPKMRVLGMSLTTDEGATQGARPELLGELARAAGHVQADH